MKICVRILNEETLNVSMMHVNLTYDTGSYKIAFDVAKHTKAPKLKKKVVHRAKNVVSECERTETQYVMLK